MAAAPQLATILDEFRTQLVARGGLAGVAVVTGAVAPDPARDETIQFTSAAVTRNRATMRASGAGFHDESLTIEGRVEVFRTNTPDLDGAPAAARLRALAVLAEVDGELDDDDTINSTCSHAQLAEYEWSDEPTDKGHIAAVEFTITAQEFVT